MLYKTFDLILVDDNLFLHKIEWLFEFAMGFYQFQTHHIYLW